MRFAVSGTGTSGLEATVANLVQDGTRVLAVVTGYFGDRLAQVCGRYGARLRRLDVEWGRACDPAAVREALAREGADIVCVVHAETSTGVLNPVRGDRRRRARGRRARPGGRRHVAWRPPARDRGVGHRRVLQLHAEVRGRAVGPRARGVRAVGARQARAVPQLLLRPALLEDYWLRRKYHHTISASLVYALHEALLAIEEEGLEARWQRHERHHLALAAGLEAMGLGLLPPAVERLWTLNAVRVPDGVDEPRLRTELLARFNMEVGAGLGPLAGKILRVGLMGAGSTPQMILLFLAALESTLASQGCAVPPGAGVAAAIAALK